jgi:hypothetical protein
MFGDVAGEWGAGPIVAPGPIIPSGPIIAPGFMCSSAFISLQQAIVPDPMCPWCGPPKPQLRKNPEKKIAATMNKPPATIPTHANA